MSANDNLETGAFDLGRFKLEPHVEEAFRIASELALGDPLNARHLLLAALTLSRTAGSDAFSKLAELLPLSVGEPLEAKAESELLLSLPVLNDSLADSYANADEFLRDGKIIWGRDYITAALLALDPSLKAIAQEAGSSVAALRDEWFRFVTSAARRRRRPKWSATPAV